MQVNQQASLRDFVTSASRQDADFVRTFSETGRSVLKNALDTYVNGAHTDTDARTVVADLLDLQEATQALMDKTDRTTRDNWAATEGRLKTLNAGGTVDGLKLNTARDEKLVNAPAMSESGTTIKKGVRKWEGQEVASAKSLYDEPVYDKQQGVSKFLVDLNHVTGLIATALMMPAPLAANINNTPEAFASGSVHETSVSSNSAAFVRGGVFRHTRASMSSGSVSTLDGQYSYSDTTADVTIVPTLMDLSQRLSRAEVAPANETTLTGSQSYQEYKTYRVFGDMELTGWHPTSTRVLGTNEFQPAHVKLPLSAVDGYVR